MDRVLCCDDDQGNPLRAATGQMWSTCTKRYGVTSKTATLITVAVTRTSNITRMCVFCEVGNQFIHLTLVNFILYKTERIKSWVRIFIGAEILRPELQRP